NRGPAAVCIWIVVENNPYSHIEETMTKCRQSAWGTGFVVLFDTPTE
ncbi:hypothetical protein L917_07456, partial [Phytophthora nicotianae]